MSRNSSSKDGDKIRPAPLPQKDGKQHGWPSTTGNPSGNGRDNAPQKKK